MSNLWEFANEYRVIDVEGVILDNPNDYILIREVSGMDETTITLSREGNSHGFDYEFSDSEKPFGFSKAMKIEGQIYDPYTLLLGIYAAKGVDGKATLELHNLNETPELQYQAELDFESLERIDYKLNLNARRINLSDLFRTRYDIPVNFGATESIDGVAVTGLTPQSMFMHSLLYSLSTVGEGVFPDVPFDQQTSSTTSGASNIYSNINYNELSVNSIEGFQLNTTVISETPIPAIISPSGGLLKINSINYKVKHSMQGTGGDSSTSYDIALYVKAGEDGVETKIGSSITGTAFQYTWNLEVNETDIYIPIPVPNVGQSVNIYIYSKTIYGNPNNRSKSVFIQTGFVNNIDLTLESVNLNSYTDVYDPFDSFNHILEMTTNGTNLLTSNFFQNVANDIYFTNGYKIRQYPNRNLIQSWKDMFDDWAQPMFGLGFAIYNDSGTFKVLLERYEEFYKDVEIDYIDTVQDDTFRISIDKEIIFNEINTGYKEYPKSTDENKTNNVDEFNTEHKHLSPIQTVKKKVEYISKTIGGGFLLESQRREQFKDVPSDTVSYDEKTFCIKGLNSDRYTNVNTSFLADTAPTYFIDLEGTFYDVSAGDTITMADTPNNNASFTVERVDIDVSGNVGFSLGMRLTVTEPVAVENAPNATLILSSTRLRAERNDNIDVLNNVISPDTVYNVGLNPKSFLFNQSPILNSGFNLKPDTAEVKTQKVFLNGEMEFSFKPGEGGYVLMPDDQTVKMDSDIALSALNGNNKLFSGLLINFTCNLTYDRVLKIRDACLNQSLLGDNYGYIRVKDFEGQDWKGWIMSMTYNPLSQQTEFILKGQFIPSGSSFDYVIESELN